ITVTPDAEIALTDKNGKGTVTATISQNDTVFEYADIKAVNESGTTVGKTVEGNITAEDLTAGKWQGILNFNIASKENKGSITVKAKNEAGEDLNASANEIVGDEKDTLLNSLVETGMINSAEDVNALIEVKSDDFDGIAETTFDVSSIANEGDKVAILHFNEVTSEWEYIGTETVDSNGIISGDFTSYSPVAFVKVNENGNYETVTKQAGLYDANGTMLCSWEESGIDVEKDRSYNSKEPDSAYYVLTNTYPETTMVVIPDGITTIGTYTFSGCTSLTSVTIPNSVTSTGNGVFENCSSLTSVTIPNSVTSIGTYTFSGCTSLTSIIIPNSVTSIGDGVFRYCSSLTSVTIPNSVTSIGSNAFSGCTSLTSVTIPDSVTNIGRYAFSGCSSLTSVTVDKNNPNYCSVDGVLFNKDKSTLIYHPSGKKDTSYTIPNSVTSIGDGAFDYCTSLASVTIPNSVISIGDVAFRGCTSLTSVTIPDSVTSIGTWVFNDCTSLTSVAIPDSVTSIGEYAFYRCSSLASVTIPNNVTSIGGYAFDGCTSLASVTIPNSVTSIGTYAFYRCSSLTSITIPNSVTSIGNYAFYECSSLTSVTIPNSVTSIGTYAFNGCTSLTSVTIPNSVTSIRTYAFNGCTSLASVTYKGTAYTNKSALNNALITNDVTVDIRAFNNTALTN
ncbi:MAG: leucine-rich repeat domain-containing protein, partial [Lachnospiraceae bacterium]|nr:leucine-rich repeat domain-containing protein [Lachnospiraceae bacterium]